MHIHALTTENSIQRQASIENTGLATTRKAKDNWICVICFPFHCRVRVELSIVWIRFEFCTHEGALHIRHSCVHVCLCEQNHLCGVFFSLWQINSSTITHPAHTFAMQTHTHVMQIE